MQMKYQLARLNEMAKRGLEMLRETHRQLEQLCRQLLSAMTARVEESTHAQSPGCDEGISEVHVGPDDPIMIEVDPITANEALGSSIVSDHGYDDDDDGAVALQLLPVWLRVRRQTWVALATANGQARECAGDERRRRAEHGSEHCIRLGYLERSSGRCGRGGLVFLALARSSARRLGDSAEWRPTSLLAQWRDPGTGVTPQRDIRPQKPAGDSFVWSV